MPQLIEHIDAIARKKQRDVLFIEFSDVMGQVGENGGSTSAQEWELLAVRQAVIVWLDREQITWCCCAGVADTHSLGYYAGQIYIDIPFDENHSVYQRMLEYLENPDGSSRLPGVLFCVLQLQIAMKNAHHDEQGFWERWAENF